MHFTARPRMGGRHAVGRQCRGVPRRDRPLMGSRPRPPPEGEGGDEMGFSLPLILVHAAYEWATDLTGV